MSQQVGARVAEERRERREFCGSRLFPLLYTMWTPAYRSPPPLIIPLWTHPSNSPRDVLYQLPRCLSIQSGESSKLTGQEFAWFFWGRVSLCSLCCPGALYTRLASGSQRSTCSACQALGLKLCTSSPQEFLFFKSVFSSGSPTLVQALVIIHGFCWERSVSLFQFLSISCICSWGKNSEGSGIFIFQYFHGPGCEIQIFDHSTRQPFIVCAP